MGSKEKTIRYIFIGALVFYILCAILGIAVFSTLGTFVGYRIPPMYSLIDAGKAERTSTAGQQIVGNVTSLNSVSYDFDEPKEEYAPTDEVPEEEYTEEVPEEQEPYEEPVPEEHFYSFTSINSTTILHMRKEPSMDSPVIAKLKPGTKGYVMEPGDDWSRVWAEGKVGYCSNEFLSLTEISKDEIPEEAVRDDEAFITGDASVSDVSEPAVLEETTDTETAPAEAPETEAAGATVSGEAPAAQ